MKSEAWSCLQERLQATASLNASSLCDADKPMNFSMKTWQALEWMPCAALKFQATRVVRLVAESVSCRQLRLAQGVSSCSSRHNISGYVRRTDVFDDVHIRMMCISATWLGLGRCTGAIGRVGEPYRTYTDTVIYVPHCDIPHGASLSDSCVYTTPQLTSAPTDLCLAYHLAFYLILTHSLPVLCYMLQYTVHFSLGFFIV